MKQSLILAFDLKEENWTMRKRIYRQLQNIGAKLIYTSHWVLPFSKENLVNMKQICNDVRSYGGKAEVIKGEKVV